eukprot:1032293-Pelagomonas_calceolata.AAC.4
MIDASLTALLQVSERMILNRKDFACMRHARVSYSVDEVHSLEKRRRKEHHITMIGMLLCLLKQYKLCFMDRRKGHVIRKEPHKEHQECIIDRDPDTDSAFN